MTCETLRLNNLTLNIYRVVCEGKQLISGCILGWTAGMREKSSDKSQYF